MWKEKWDLLETVYTGFQTALNCISGFDVMPSDIMTCQNHKGELFLQQYFVKTIIYKNSRQSVKLRHNRAFAVSQLGVQVTDYREV